MATAELRPIIRYHGSKWRLAQWIASQFPRHRVYCEPFGGSAAVLLQKTRSYSEVYNDLDGEIVNLFRVLRDRADELVRAISLTPFSRDEYECAFEVPDDAVEWARRTLVRSHMSFGGSAIHGTKTGFRGACNDVKSIHPAERWMGLPERMTAIVERLQGVVIENRDATEVIKQQDGSDTLFYVDPPYMPSTRVSAIKYRHELTVAAHSNLVDLLAKVRGRVAVSGYATGEYDRLVGAGWKRIENRVLDGVSKLRTEILWLSPNCEIRGQRSFLEQYA